MNTLRINNLELYGFHGALEEERRIGGRYFIDVMIQGDFAGALRADDLHGTVDYSTICALIKKEFSVSSQLIEHIAHRILNEIYKVPLVKYVEVTVTKLAPPVIPQPKSVSISVSR